MYGLKREKLNLAGLKQWICKDMKERTYKRVQINNLLINEDWAAIHFWEATTEQNGEKDVFNHMYFFHFTDTPKGLKADMVWAR